MRVNEVLHVTVCWSQKNNLRKQWKKHFFKNPRGILRSPFVAPLNLLVMNHSCFLLPFWSCYIVGFLFFSFLFFFFFFFVVCLIGFSFFMNWFLVLTFKIKKSSKVHYIQGWSLSRENTWLRLELVLIFFLALAWSCCWVRAYGMR